MVEKFEIFEVGPSIVAMGNGVIMTPMGNAPAIKPPNEPSKNDKWVPWGDDNNFPQAVVAASEKSTVIAPAIDKQIRFSYAGGIQAGKIEIVDGEERFVPVKNKDFDNFKRASNLNNYLLEAFSDLYWFTNVFPNFILNRERTKIVQLFVEEASYCRWAWPSEKSGLIEKCYISPDFGNLTALADDRIMEVDALDPYFNPVEQIKKGSKYRYIYPLSYPSPNRFYYQLAPWNGAIASGWLEFSLQIPAFKKAMMKNQITPNYHLEVNEAYWPSLYADWGKLDDKVKAQRKIEFQTKISESLTGVDAAAKTIMSQFYYEKNGDERVAWRIKPIDDKIKDGVYVEDSQEASTHLMNAMGLDPTLFGNGPGKGFSAGSGSDKNSAYNLYMASIQPHHDKILEPLYVIRDFNNWDPELEFRFKKTFMSGSTSGKPTMQPANG